MTLPGQAWRTVTWREGMHEPAQCKPAQCKPAQSWLSNLPPRTALKRLCIRPERHVLHPIATIRCRLTASLVSSLPRCPCCLQVQNHKRNNTVA
jgi:hypothetical protein